MSCKMCGGLGKIINNTGIWRCPKCNPEPPSREIETNNSDIADDVIDMGEDLFREYNDEWY